MSLHPDTGSAGAAGATGGGSEVVELTVSGMHCQSCAALVEEVLSEQDGVHAASVDLTRARARVEYDPTALGPPELAEAVAGAGYTASPASG